MQGVQAHQVQQAPGFSDWQTRLTSGRARGESPSRSDEPIPAALAATYPGLRRGAWWFYTTLSAAATAVVCGVLFTALPNESPNNSAVAASLTLAPTPAKANAVAPSSLSNQGQSALDAGHLDDASVLFSRALANDSTDLVALSGLGRIALSRGEYEDAASWYRRGVQIEPQHGPSVFGLGQALFGLRQFERASIQFERAMRLDEPGAEEGLQTSRVRMQRATTDDKK